MKTPVFTISSSAYMRELAFVWLGKWWPVLVVPLAGAAIWSVYDLRAVYVGLIMIFMVYPMVMSFVWFGYAFSPAALRAVAPKCLIFRDDSITVEYDEAEGCSSVYAPMQLRAADIRSVEARKGHYTLVYDRTPECRLLIPTDVLDDEMKRVLQTYSPEQTDMADAF